MQTGEDIQKLRSDYQQVRRSVVQGNASSIKKEQIVQSKKTLINETNAAQQNQHYENIEQLIAYRQKYDSMISLMKEAKDKNYSKDKYQTQAEKIFNDQPSMIKSDVRKVEISNSVLNRQDNKPLQLEAPRAKITSNPALAQTVTYNNSSVANNPDRLSNAGSGMIKTQSKRNSFEKDQLMSFFHKQQSKLKDPNQGFKSVLQKPPLAIRSFKKKNPGIANNQMEEEVQKLRLENRQLQELVNLKARQKNDIEREKYGANEQKSKAFERISYLQNQIQYLSKDNLRLRHAQRSIKSHSNKVAMNNQLQDAQNNVNAPYIIKPCTNDLRKISQKNLQGKGRMDQLSRDGSERVRIMGDQKQLSNIRNQFNQVDSRYKHQVKSVSSMSINRGDHFDSFAMATSEFGTYSSGNRGLGVRDPVTCTRNKVAFFKNSLIIAKDYENQIAFKKSNLNPSMDQIRIIIYINNKTTFEQSVDINYKDDAGLYTVQVLEKLTYIEPNSQGREVITVGLRNIKQLNSILDAQVRISQKIYNIWVPANFIKFDYKQQQEMGTMESVTITPDKQFATYESAASILPLTDKETVLYQTTAYLNAKSKVHTGSFKLTWLSDRKLNIQASTKWADYLGFILCNYRQ